MRRWIAFITLAGIVLAVAGAACSDKTTVSRAPTATRIVATATETAAPTRTPLRATTTQRPTDTPVAISPEDAAAIDNAIRAFYQAYNEDDMVGAISYVSISATQSCGGAPNHASAYVQLKRIENLRYEVDDVHLNSVTAEAAQADVRRSAFAVDTGHQIDFGLPLGFDFVREGGQWVHADDPLPASPFC